MNDSSAIIFLASMMALKDYVRNFFKTVWPGFVESCEFLRKSWNLPSNFPDLEKVWKMEIKSGKMVKSLEFFLMQLYKWNLFCFGQILFNLALMFAVHCEKNFVPAFFKKKWKVCLDHLFDNLESGKINYCFGKKCGKSLELWIQKSVRTMCNRSDLFFFFFYYSVLLFFHKPSHFKKEKSTKCY